jgi:hypothetical protein
MRNLDNVLPALDLIEIIITVLDSKKAQFHDIIGGNNEPSRGNDEDLVLDLQASVNNFNTFYVDLCALLT